MEELWKAHKTGQMKRLRDARPDLPDRFVQAVERALAPAPADRYESAGEMEAALAAAMGVVPLSATPQPLAGPAVSDAAARPPVAAFLRRPTAVIWGAGLLAVALGAAVYWGGRATPPEPAASLAPVGQIERIAVLPFENVSGDQNEAHLAGGVSLELTARLGQIGAMKVMPWSFMRTFESGGRRSIPDVRRATNADAIVDGSVQVVTGTDAARTVRVNVQVFHAGTGMTLWSRSYDRAIGDFLRLQGDIAQAIAAELRIRLGRREELLLTQAPQADPEAMELYLKGRQAWDERDAEGMRRGLEYFRLASERDPDFAPAYVGIADSYSLLSAYYGEVSGQDALARALDATSRAIDLDPSLADAWTSRGFARFVFAWEWEAARADFAKALEIDPQSTSAHHWYSDYLTALGRHDEAIRESRLAEERAPLSPPLSRQVAWALFYARRYDEAVDQLKKTLALDPDFVPAHTLLGRAYVQRGEYDQAIAELAATGPSYLDVLAQAYAAAGRRADAERTLAEARAAGCPPYGIALAYAVLGQRDLAFEWLERAYQVRDQGIANLRIEPLLDSLRDDPRFVSLLARLKFPA
jgi:TolB-like protein/Flp pilus assembly protein TadD